MGSSIMNEHNYHTPRTLEEAFGRYTTNDLYLPAPHPLSAHWNLFSAIMKGLRHAANEAFKAR